MKMKTKLKKKLSRASAKQSKYESLLNEVEFENKKKEKLKEFEDQLDVNGVMIEEK